MATAADTKPRKKAAPKATATSATGSAPANVTSPTNLTGRVSQVIGAVVDVDADVQPVANRTRPANAAVTHRTLLQAQTACQSDRRHNQDVGCSHETDALARGRRLSRFLTSVRYAASAA